MKGHDEPMLGIVPTVTRAEALRSQLWASLGGAAAWNLIHRHAESWGEVELMMDLWRAAQTGPLLKAAEAGLSNGKASGQSEESRQNLCTSAATCAENEEK